MRTGARCFAGIFQDQISVGRKCADRGIDLGKTYPKLPHRRLAHNPTLSGLYKWDKLIFTRFTALADE
jgi:hypothetical protein